MLYRTIGMALPFLLLTQISIAQDSLNVLKIESTDALKDYFHHTGNDLPLVSAHRGGASAGYPENCIATFEHTLRNTPATFEIDPRLTKDSIIVLHHDATLERTTDGTGKLSDHTWEEVKKLRLKDPEGNLTEYGIPTLKEAILWSKGKTVLILDKKDVPPEMTASLIKELKAESHVMVTVHNAAQALFYYRDNPEIVMEAFVKTKKALKEYEEAGIPWEHIMAYVGLEETAEAKEICERLHERGAMCMISTAPVYDKMDREKRTGAYRSIIENGTDIIEADRAVEVGRLLKKMSPESSSKKKYFAIKSQE
ncbi:glycerophosphodiester phosphodiesterase family protein [Sinomicrobium sp. M5D2P17]